MGICQSKKKVKQQRITKGVSRNQLKKPKREQQQNVNTFTENDLKRSLDEIFTKYDKDHNETLEKDEIRNMLKDLAGRKNKKSKITDEQVNLNIDRMFDKADKDKSGHLNREQFYLFYKGL